jgi:MFS family permease
LPALLGWSAIFTPAILMTDTGRILAQGERWRSFVAATGCTAIAGMAMGITWPLLALILHRQGVSESLIGLSSASQSLAVFLAAPLAPRLMRRVGLGGCVLGGIGVVALMMLVLPAILNVFAWFPIRFLLGAGASTLFIATQTWVNAIAADESRGRTIGAFGLLWAAGFAAGPLVIRVTGIEGWPPFLASLALMAVAAIPLLGARELVPEIASQSVPRMWGYFRHVPAAIYAALLLGAVDYILDAFLPIYALHQGMLQTDAVTLLSVLLAGVTLAQLPAGWLSDRMDRQRLLTVMALAGAVLSFSLPLSIQTLWSAYPVVGCLGAALGAIWTISIVLLGARYRGAELAGAYAATGVLHGIGMVAGPVLAGSVATAWSPAAIPLAVGLCCLIYLPVTLIRSR